METQSSRSLNERFRSAIRQKRLIQLRYHGRPRVAEPHDYGIHQGLEWDVLYARVG